MEKDILEKIKQDKRFSFEGELIIRKEGKSTYVYDKQGNILEKTYADGSKDVYKFGIKMQIGKARTIM